LVGNLKKLTKTAKAQTSIAIDEGKKIIAINKSLKKNELLESKKQEAATKLTAAKIAALKTNYAA